MHFSGHGSRASAGITLHGPDGGSRAVSAAALRHLFDSAGDGVKLVVLNACYTEEQAVAINETVDCVVGMSDAIEDESARVFAASFYRAIAFGKSVRKAFEQGLAAIGLEGLQGEHVPRLLVRPGTAAQDTSLVTNSQSPKSSTLTRASRLTSSSSRPQEKKGQPNGDDRRGSLNISSAAQKIIDERPLAWGVKLFGQTLEDGIVANGGLKQELSLGRFFWPIRSPK